MLSYPGSEGYHHPRETGVRGGSAVRGFRKLHSNQGTNFGSWIVAEVCQLFGIHKTQTTPYHPRSDGFIERSFRTLGCCLKAACRETRQGRIGANHTNELLGDAPGEYKSDAEHDVVGMTDSAAYSGHLRSALGTSSGREDGEPVCGGVARRTESRVSACQSRPAASCHASATQLRR